MMHGIATRPRSEEGRVNTNLHAQLCASPPRTAQRPLRGWNHCKNGRKVSVTDELDEIYLGAWSLN